MRRAVAFECDRFKPVKLEEFPYFADNGGSIYIGIKIYDPFPVFYFHTSSRVVIVRETACNASQNLLPFDFVIKIATRF